MPVSVSPNHIQETQKNTSSEQPCALDAQIAALATLLRSHSLIGEVLRVLVGLVQRMPPPRTPYTGQEIEVLLILSLALERAGL